MKFPIVTLAAACLFLCFAPARGDDSTWPGRAVVGDVLQRNGLEEAFQGFTQSLHALLDRCRSATEPELGGDRVLPVVERIFDDPLSMVDEVLALGDSVFAAARRDDPGQTVSALAMALDLSPAPLDRLELPPRDAPLEVWLDFLASELEAIQAARERAFAGVPEEQQRFLAYYARTLLGVLSQTLYLEYSPEDTLPKLIGAIRLSLDVDFEALVEAGQRAGRLLARPVLLELRQVLRRFPADSTAACEGVEGPLLAVRETPAGTLILGGAGPNRYARAAALIVDLSGDDRYLDGPGACLWFRPFQTEPPGFVSLLADLSGDDLYRVEAPEKSHCAQAGALLGVAVLADLEGNDRYEGGRFAQGVGLYGVGILADYEGDDRYLARDFCQGAGAFGLGLLLDRAGDDRYEAQVHAQAAGYPLGVGCLVDLQGSDSTRCTGTVPSTYGTEGEYNGFCQGVGVGFRGYPGEGCRNWAGGGVGLLLDDRGDDVYEAGEFGLGCGYYFGLGAVVNREGDDHYQGSRYGIATGAHQAQGILIDLAGNDRYEGRSVANQAGNWDGVLSLLWDAAGDDSYRCAAGLAQGAATITSFALLLDGDGVDGYAAGGGDVQGSGGHPHDAVRGSLSFGLLVDLGGREDSYQRGGKQPQRENGARAATPRKDAEGVVLGWGVFEDR